MTADEVMAAGPDADWEIERRASGEVYRLGALEALPLAGQLFEVVILPRDEHSRYQLGFHSRTMIDMDACEEDFLAVVAEMEAQLGPFSPSSSIPIPAGEKVLAAGRASTVEADRDRRNALWATVRLSPYPYDGHHALLNAHFNGGDGAAAGCFISVHMVHEPEAAG